MTEQIRNRIFSIICFVFPFSIYFITQSSSLMFDDAGEFATVIKLGSIAHPPGTPAYIFLGMFWDKIISLFSHSTIFNLNLFSITVSSVASFLFYKTIRTILNHVTGTNSVSLKNDVIAISTALCFATEVTNWTWSNTIEVYALQTLAMSLLLFGLVHFHVTRKTFYILLASLGYAFGLSNHHLTVILFTPFIPFFFFTNLFFAKPEVQKEKKDKKKNVKTNKQGFITTYMNVLKTKPFLQMVVVTSTVTFGFYFWMYLRAQHDYPFMFGKPDTLHELIYHVTGGSYGKNLESTSHGILQSRIPYFLHLTLIQFLFFLPLVIVGLYEMIRKKLFGFISLILIYFSFLFIYQLNNNQWENTDAYMILPFMVLTITIAFGSLKLFESLKLMYVLPVLIIIQTVINFPKCNRRDYNISESLMHQLDVSAPKNSIIIISDWSLLIQYYYYRIVENFRPDLVVLNQDIKFNHYKVIQILYPYFYKSIKPEFDHFIDEMSNEHPEQVTNTGCDLSTPKLVDSFYALITKIETVARQQNRALLTDPRTHYFYTQQKFYSPERYVSGCFVSSIKSDSNDEFLKFDMKWLKSPMLENDLTALNKMVDYQAMFDNYINYYTNVRDTVRLELAVAAKDKVMKLQRELKRNISFAYKLK